jgi:acetyl esterase/lipase
MQDVPGMIEAFRMYAGDLDVNHPFVSPLNADLNGLAPMLIFTGTHDLFHPDIVALANRAAQAGVPVEMHLRKGFNTIIRCCRPQKGARHAASLRAQWPVSPFELTTKLPLRCYEQLEFGFAVEKRNPGN